MEYEGILYRPPSEARSLIIQVTIGCAHNRCTFCNMYRAKKFRVRSKEEIMADLDECRAYYGPMIRRVFFADGDALVVKEKIRGRFKGAGGRWIGAYLSGSGIRGR